jgi:hypothetical protein
MRYVTALALAAVALGPAGAGNSQRVIVGQQIVDEFVGSHPELLALELSVTTPDGCRTIAATAREDVGTKCDGDELRPIRTGIPDVELPTKHDPVYDITQALHDASGRLIGAAGMDLKPDVGSRQAAVAHAEALLRELESRIGSKAQLQEPAAP